MIRILYTLPALDCGGIDRIIFDYVTRLPENYQADFIVHTEYEGILEPALIDRGGRVFHVKPFQQGKKQYLKTLSSIIREGNYDIVHVNQGFKGLFYLFYAKRYGIKIRIAHSHTSYIPETFKSKIIRRLSTCLVKYYATHLFACGLDAAKWMWGERSLKKEQIHYMKNAIDVERFAFSCERRSEVRKLLNLEGKFVVGNVARFSEEKNHAFMVELFAKIHEVRKDSVLLFVGRGPLEEEIKKKVRDLNIEESVLFLGVREDVPVLLNAMDVFLLPSTHEGLPVTLVEVQTNGLPAYVSDVITDEIRLSDKLVKLPLSFGADVWAKRILKENHERYELPYNSYAICANVVNLQKQYDNMLKDIERS